MYNEYSTTISKTKYKATHEEGLKILVPKQMLYRLPIALSPIKGSKAPENVLNEIHQIIYSLYRANEITKKVYNRIINSINS